MDNNYFLFLVSRKLSGEASESELLELERILEEFSDFRQKYDLFKLYWENRNNSIADCDTALKKTIEKIKFIENQSAGESLASGRNESLVGGKSKVKQFFLLFTRVAAVLLIFLGSVYLFYHVKEKKSEIPVTSIIKPHVNNWVTKQNPNGAKSSIKLSDGSHVILNAGSKLEFPKEFSGNTREVYLYGEAFFDVARNPQVPFIIHAGKMNIKVLGTEFNVKSYPGDSISETTLIRGLVEVTINGRPSDKIILRPSEKLIVFNNADSGSLSTTKTPMSKDTRLTISTLNYVSPTDSSVLETEWIHNRLIFRDESFGNLARDMERRYDVNINFKNSVVRDYRFTGAFEKESIVEALEALRLTEKFNYKIQNNNITIY